MSSAFPDHFSSHAASYARFRPRYPTSLFDRIAELAVCRDRAWDVGTGNGQAAVALSAHFTEVVATDASREQIGQTKSHERVTFRVARADASGLVEGSVDVITVAQALHWFPFEAFYQEVRRVARPGALIVAWGYELLHVNPTVDAALNAFYTGPVGKFWPPERGHLETGYRNIPWPFPPVAFGDHAMRADYTLDDLLGYVGTWSSVARYQKATGDDPLPSLRKDLERVWGSPDRTQAVTWPLIVLAGRVER